MNRKEFSVSHTKLNRAQAVTLRLLRTQTYSSTNFISTLFREGEIPINWEDCSGIITLYLMLWQCPVIFRDCGDEKDWWRLVLHSGLLSYQVRVFQKARDTAARLNLIVPTWKAPRGT